MRVDIAGAVHQLCTLSHPVAVPTETVWGLAAPVHNEACIRTLFALKGRPSSNPLIIHVADAADVGAYATGLPPGFLELTGVFWPGPLTLVVSVREEAVLPIVRAGLPTAAFRQPNHVDTLRLIESTGPLVAPSANRSGSPSAVTPQHIEDDFGPYMPILDTGLSCHHGIESTILIWGKGRWVLGRYGAVDPKAIESVLGYTPSPSTAATGAPICPGQLHRHYAPRANMTISGVPWDSHTANQYDGVLGFSDRSYIGAQDVVYMGESTSARSVYQRLYSALRELDRRNLCTVFVDTYAIQPAPEWLALLDRLHRASFR